MSDGGNWYPGGSDPRYDDPYAPAQQPPYGPPPQAPRPVPPRQGQRQGPGQQGYGRPQVPGQGRDPGYDQDYGDQGYGDAGYGPQAGRGRSPYGPQGTGSQQGQGYPPQRQVPPPRGPRTGAGPGQGRRGAYTPPEDRVPEDPWAPASSPSEGGDWDAAEAGPRARRRSGAGRGPGRQTDASTGPGHVNEDIDLDEVDPSGRAQRAWAKKKAGKKRSRAKQATKWTAIGMSLVLLAALGFVAYAYETTVGSIKHSALLPSGMSQTPLPPDKFGNKPMNILLIGSDTRDTAADCNLGGDCTSGGSNSGANADSEMILHVSAERTNATILSIPRDTMAMLPDCTQDKSGTTSLTGRYSTYQVNSALQYGPACQVAAVQYLTKITITGYIMFDFSGIITMSNALGGVPVCVTKPVHDIFPSSGSGLVLPAGISTIKGQQALEFLRTRDSFFDGSDLGREEATHYFLSQLVQTLRKNLNFSNIGTLLSIGQAAAHSTTVSDNFAGLSSLEGLMTSLNKVPTSAITMLTTPWEQDPQNKNRVIVDQSAATPIFQAIQNDTSFTSTSSDSSSSASPSSKSSSAAPSTSAAAPNVDKPQVPVNVYNADQVSGRASTIVNALKSDGFTDTVSQGNAPVVSSSVVLYDPNEATQAGALAVAAALNIPSSQVQSTTQRRGVSVFIGTDFESGTTLGGSGSGSGSGAGSSAVSASAAPSAPTSAHESFASGSANECIPVNSGTLQMATTADVK